MKCRMCKRALYRCLAIPAFFLLCGLSADAGTIVEGGVVIDIQGVVGETVMTDQVVIPVQEDGSFNMQNVVSETALWEGDVGAWGNVDPFTNFAFHVTNIMPGPVAFTLGVTIPIAPIPVGTLHGGSTGGSTTDSNGNGVGGVSTLAGIPFYAGQIDGLTVLPIYPDPSSWTFTFAGQTITIPALNPGLPGPTIPSGPALATIGIVHSFTLSPGDSAAGTSFFQVEQIPEPASIVLALVGAVGFVLLVRRRRRK